MIPPSSISKCSSFVPLRMINRAEFQSAKVGKSRERKEESRRGSICRMSYELYYSYCPLGGYYPSFSFFFFFFFSFSLHPRRRLRCRMITRELKRSLSLFLNLAASIFFYELTTLLALSTFPFGKMSSPLPLIFYRRAIKEISSDELSR